MTDNETKLLKVTERYQILKSLAEISPIVATVLLVVVLAIQLTTLPYILQVVNAEKAQNDYQQRIIPTRVQHRDSLELVMLEKIDYIIQDRKMKTTIDSLKAVILNSKK